MAFTITRIDEQGGVSVRFDVDNKVQHLSGLPIQDPDLLVEALQRYETAYVRGLREEAPSNIHGAVQGLIGRAI